MRSHSRSHDPIPFGVSTIGRINLILPMLALLVGCGEVTGTLEDPDRVIEVPSDFPEVPYPDDNEPTAAKIELGRHLFYDTRLSFDNTVACATCHVQANGFADTNRFSFGVEGRLGRRNAPSLGNIGYARFLNWEGGVPTLEQQAIVPITHPDEMAMNTDSVVARLRRIPIYRDLFARAWGSDTISFAEVTKSLGTFQRSLVTGNSRFDRFNRGDTDAMSEQEQRGQELFFGETGDCFHCHVSFNFSDNDFHNNGLSATEDVGRFDITQNRFDRGAFRTPTLRNIEVTFPYMHDGRFATLREVVEFYNDGGQGHPMSDPLVRPLGMTDQQVDDLVAFLLALTDDEFLTDTTHASPWE